MRSSDPCRPERLAALAAGALCPSEADAVRSHARNCPACRDRLATLERVLSLVRPTAAPAFGPAEAPAFLHRVRRDIRTRYGARPPWWRRPWAALLAGAAAGAVGAALVLGPPAPPALDAAAPDGVEDWWAAATAGAVSPETDWAAAVDDYLLATASEYEMLERLEALVTAGELRADALGG